MTYSVAIKKSVFRDTPLDRDDFGEDPRLAFESETEAEEWIEARNDELPVAIRLNLHTAHPNDASDVDAYLVSRPKGAWTPDS